MGEYTKKGRLGVHGVRQFQLTGEALFLSEASEGVLDEGVKVGMTWVCWKETEMEARIRVLRA